MRPEMEECEQTYSTEMARNNTCVFRMYMAVRLYTKIHIFLIVLKPQMQRTGIVPFHCKCFNLY